MRAPWWTPAFRRDVYKTSGMGVAWSCCCRGYHNDQAYGVCICSVRLRRNLHSLHVHEYCPIARLHSLLTSTSPPAGITTVTGDHDVFNCRDFSYCPGGDNIDVIDAASFDNCPSTIAVCFFINAVSRFSLHFPHLFYRHGGRRRATLRHDLQGW